MIEVKEIGAQVKKEARWAIDIIESNKLYEINFEMGGATSAGGEEKNMDSEAKAWLNMTTSAANDTTQWFERDLGWKYSLGLILSVLIADQNINL